LKKEKETCNHDQNESRQVERRTLNHWHGLEPTS